MAKEKKEKELQRWNNVTGQAKIFGNEQEYKKNGKKMTLRKFTTSLSIKDENDGYVNYYINVRFKKDEEPKEDIVDINILSGFLTFDLNNEQKYLKLVVTDYEIL